MERKKASIPPMPLDIGNSVAGEDYQSLPYTGNACLANAMDSQSLLSLSASTLQE